VKGELQSPDNKNLSSSVCQDGVR